MSDVLHTFMEAQAVRLTKRGEDRPQEFTHSNDILHICTRRLYFNRIYGGYLEHDLATSARMYAGEVLEEPNIADFLADSEGKLKIAKLRGRYLIDTHDYNRNPTAWRDRKLEFGGRFDAATVDRKGIIRLIESKTISKDFAEAIHLVWMSGNDVFDWFWNQSEFWFTPMFCGQAAAYVHGFNLKYAKEIKAGEIEPVHEVDFILKPERGLAYYVRADLDQYPDLTKRVLTIAEAIRDAVKSGDPSALWCKRSSRWCGTADNPKCPHFDRCQAEQEETPTERILIDPAIVAATEAFAELDGQDKEFKARRELLRSLVLAAVDHPDPGGKASLRLQLGETGYEASVSLGWSQPKQIDVIQEDAKRGWVAEDKNKIPVSKEDAERGYVEIGEVKPTARFDPQKVKEEKKDVCSQSRISS